MTKSRSQGERRLAATAYHEAGHAVAAIDHEWKVRRVSIAPTADTLGHMMRYKKSSFRPDVDAESIKARTQLESLAIICMAGEAAERRYTGRRNRVGAASDIRKIADLVSYRFRNDERVVMAYYRYIQEYADAMMRNPLVWTKVRAVARLLIERTTISGQDATAAAYTALAAYSDRMATKSRRNT